MSALTQCSTYLPSFSLMMSMTPKVTFRPVGATPRKGPWWVAS